MKHLFLASIITFALCGCASNAPVAEKPAESTPAKTDAQAVAFRNAEGKLLCPVNGTVIDSEKDAVGFQDYKGKRYYFCCNGCPQKFKADPAKYAKN